MISIMFIIELSSGEFMLPAVTQGKVKKWPVVTILPVGWLYSVFVGKMIHEEIISKVEGIKQASMILPSSSREI